MERPPQIRRTIRYHSEHGAFGWKPTYLRGGDILDRPFCVLSRNLHIDPTAEALAAKGAMLAKDFAKESEAGAKTGYVDKALSADKLKTARAVTLAGAITGNTTFDGSKDISIETSLKPLEEQDIPELSLSKIKDAGTAAACNTGTEAGQIPVIGEGGKLNEALIPQQTLTTDNVNEGKKNLYYTNERVTNYLQDTANTFVMDGGNA